MPALWLSCILGRALNWDCIIGKAPPFLLWLIAKVSLGVKLYCGLWIFSSEKRGTSGTQQLALTSRDQKRRRAGGEQRDRETGKRDLWKIRQVSTKCQPHCCRDHTEAGAEI